MTVPASWSECAGWMNRWAWCLENAVPIAVPPWSRRWGKGYHHSWFSGQELETQVTCLTQLTRVELEQHINEKVEVLGCSLGRHRMWRWSSRPSPCPHKPEEVHLVKNDPHPAAGLLLAATRTSCRAGPWELVKGLASKSLPSWGLPTPVLSVEAQRNWASDPHVRQCVSGRAEIWIQRFPTPFSMLNSLPSVMEHLLCARSCGGTDKEGVQSLCIYVGDVARAKDTAGPSPDSVVQHTPMVCTVHTAVSRQTASTSRQQAVRRSRLLSQPSEGHHIVLGRTAGGWDWAASAAVPLKAGAGPWYGR